MSILPHYDLLKDKFNDHCIRVEKIGQGETNWCFWVRLTIESKSWKIYVDDEYDEFNESKQVVALFLTLAALEDYKGSSDFLNWAGENNLNASDSKWLEYYKSLEKSYNEITAIIGKINSLIPIHDYSMRTDLWFKFLEKND